MTFPSPCEACMQLAGVLGLGDKPIRRISVQVGHDEAVTATVEFLVTRDELPGVLSFVKPYQLVVKSINGEP